MSTRNKLPNRRAIETVTFTHTGGIKYIASLSRFDDGDPAELFLNSDGKQGSEADINASDGAVAVSLALQYGCSLNTLRTAMKRDKDGSAQGVIGAALDILSSNTRG